MTAKPHARRYVRIGLSAFITVSSQFVCPAVSVVRYIPIQAGNADPFEAFLTVPETVVF